MIMTATNWMSYATTLSESGIQMVPESTNLVDIIWTDRPPHSADPAFVLPLQFAGVSWQDKVEQVRTEMLSRGTSMVMLSALDEVAWLLNLRGNDIPYNPVFRGYIILGQEQLQLFTPSEKVTPQVEDHLNTQHCTSGLCVKILDYQAIEDSLKALEDDPFVSSVLINPSTLSYALYSAIPVTKRVAGPSPILGMKATKNPVEIKGMRNAHLKDAVALCDFLALLEREVTMGVYWDELSAATKSEEFRRQQQNYVQLSFATISAFGPNGAIIHYQPSSETNIPLDTSSLYLIDSGAQFLDGTTDVTRTVHFGSPTLQQVEAYTRVLQGQLDFADVVFPANSGISLTDIEILARKPLYQVGLNYLHGTSHGVGMFLYVHESTLPAFGVGEFLSDEPGFYVDGEYGIRLENVVEVVEAITPYNFSGPSLSFWETTLVPYEPKLINTTLLTRHQCDVLNRYHTRVKEEVGAEMLTQGLQEAYTWLLSKTNPISC
ncbi:xaa-Pro aminopeptidase 1-like isoform X2 [Scylla paramamosain]